MILDNIYLRALDVTMVDSTHYKNPSMLILMPRCNFKCNIESNSNICNNFELRNNKFYMLKRELINRYILDSLNKAIVFAGLEPFDNTPYDIDTDAKELPIKTYKPLETDIYDTCGLNIKYASSYTDMIDIIIRLRKLYKCIDDIVIYTGYNMEELLDINDEHGSILPIIKIVNEYDGDIYIKYGRYKEWQYNKHNPSYFNNLLGVNLPTANQYVIKYSQDETEFCGLNVTEEDIDYLLVKHKESLISTILKETRRNETNILHLITKRVDPEIYNNLHYLQYLTLLCIGNFKK